MMPPIEEMTVDQRANAFDRVVRTSWEGLGVDVSFFHQGDFAAWLLLPMDLAQPETQPSVLREIAASALHEADRLGVRARGIPQEIDEATAKVVVIGSDEQTPLEDGVFRVGLAPVVFRDPSAIVFFSGEFEITGPTLRAFARLCEGQAAAIERHFPPQPMARKPAERRGPKRESIYSGHLARNNAEPAVAYADDEEDSAFEDMMPQARAPRGRVSVPAPDPEPYADDEPPPPPKRRTRPGQPRQGPISVGTPDGQGMPAQPIEPIQPRIPSKKRR